MWVGGGGFIRDWNYQDLSNSLTFEMEWMAGKGRGRVGIDQIGAIRIIDRVEFPLKYCGRC